LGAALASVFTAGLVVPPESKTKYDDKFGALCTFGQPRVGNALYTNKLEAVLSKDRIHRRCDCSCVGASIVSQKHMQVYLFHA